MRIDYQFETLTVARSLNGEGPRELCLLWSVAVARLCLEETPSEIVPDNVADQYLELLHEIEHLERGPSDDERLAARLNDIAPELDDPAARLRATEESGPDGTADVRAALRM